MRYQIVIGSNFQLQSKQVGAEHAGRESWLWSKYRIAFLHNGISLGKIKIEEQHDIISGVFGKYKGNGVKIQEVGNKSILIAGCPPGLQGYKEIASSRLK